MFTYKQKKTQISIYWVTCLQPIFHLYYIYIFWVGLSPSITFFFKTFYIYANITTNHNLVGPKLFFHYLLITFTIMNNKQVKRKRIFTHKQLKAYKIHDHLLIQIRSFCCCCMWQHLLIIILFRLHLLFSLFFLKITQNLQ